MIALVFIGSSFWGIGVGLLFLYLLERDARLVVHRGSRWPLTRWLRPLVAAMLVFAPAFIHGVAIMGSLFGFITGRTVFLAYWTRVTKGRGTS